jgi:hypothetical protein
MGRACSTGERDENHEQKVLSESVKRRHHLEYIDADRRIILQRILKNMKLSAGFIWLRIGTSCRIL